MFEVVDFWLGMGVDGLRLDAAPYLFEREGTSCENLPETHAFLRDLRAHIDARFQDRMLLAEANQWPEEAVAYFGEGDECHMAFHFPMMPRLFVAVEIEDRFPVADILAQTPPVPAGCQWALFLRNHDELTLEMVTDDERDAMVRAYASEPVMRINLGIRRRLAPLVGNSRRRIELMNALLFSLPGTPVRSLWRRDRDGGQRVPRRSQRGADADAVERGQERGLLARAAAEAGAAGDPGSGIPLRGRQRGAAAGGRGVAPVVDEAAGGAAQAARGVRARVDRALPARQPARARVRAAARGGEHPGVREFLALRAAGGAGSRGLPGGGAGGAVRGERARGRRGRALSADARGARVLLGSRSRRPRATRRARRRTIRPRSTGRGWRRSRRRRGSRRIRRRGSRRPAGGVERGRSRGSRGGGGGRRPRASRR